MLAYWPHPYLQSNQHHSNYNLLCVNHYYWPGTGEEWNCYTRWILYWTFCKYTGVLWLPYSRSHTCHDNWNRNCFFIIGLTLYYLTTKRCCACSDVSGPNDIRISISLISSTSLGTLVLIILLFAGVGGDGSVMVSSISICVEQIILLFVNCISNLKEDPRQITEIPWKKRKPQQKELNKSIDSYL